MVKKEGTQTLAYVVIVAIVAIVAGVVLVLNWNGDQGNEEAIAGEAIKLGSKCPYCQWDNWKFCNLIADLPIRNSVQFRGENGEILYDIKNVFMNLNSAGFNVGGGDTGFLKPGEVAPLVNGATLLLISIDSVEAPWKAKLCLTVPGNR